MHHSTTCRCSSCDSVGLSPVVPTGTRPSVPSAICQSTRPRKAFSSSEPLAKGVTSAVNEPLKLVLAVMIRSSESPGCDLGSRLRGYLPQQCSPHIVNGKRVQMKAPGGDARRLFAAVGDNGRY